MKATSAPQTPDRDPTVNISFQPETLECWREEGLPGGVTPGVYRLHLHLPQAVQLKVGRLGTFTFPAGRYVYTGSALSGLGARLARHWRRCKKLHWHIDYLLRHARIEGVTVLRTRQRLECALNEKTLKRPGAQVIAPGFGSSDCRCRAHLVYLG